MAWALVLAMAAVAISVVALRASGALMEASLPIHAADASTLDRLRNDPAWDLDSFAPASVDSVRLDGVFRAPPDRDALVILYFHGNGAGGLPSAYALVEGLDPEGRWGAAAYTHRGYGTSSGQSTILTMRSDAIEMVDRVLILGDVSPDRLVVIGFSIGVVSAQEVGAVLSRRGTPPHAVVLSATGFRRSFPLRILQDMDWELALRDEVAAPLLITHGLRDAVIDIADAEADFAALQNPRARFLVVDGEHNHFDAARAELRAFIEAPE